MLHRTELKRVAAAQHMLSEPAEQPGREEGKRKKQAGKRKVLLTDLITCLSAPAVYLHTPPAAV